METIDIYLNRLASDSPTPGGGSAAAIVAASGAALVAMVARICLASPKYERYRELASQLIARADTLRAELLQARVIDEAAFAKVIAAQALPQSKTDRSPIAEQQRDTRSQALGLALYEAAEAPLHTAKLALAVEKLAARLLEIPNRNLVSDIGCAVEFAYSAVMACGYNVRINHQFMHDSEAIAHQSEELGRCEREATALLHGMRAAISGEYAI